MKHIEQYYRNLCEQLQQQLLVLEAKVAEKKKKKGKKLDPVGKEDADIDNDGEENTKTDKYLLNRRKARGKAIKGEIKEGRQMQSTDFIYGGFPRILTEAKEKKIKTEITASELDALHKHADDLGIPKKVYAGTELTPYELMISKIIFNNTGNRSDDKMNGLPGLSESHNRSSTDLLQDFLDNDAGGPAGVAIDPKIHSQISEYLSPLLRKGSLDHAGSEHVESLQAAYKLLKGQGAFAAHIEDVLERIGDRAHARGVQSDQNKMYFRDNR